MRRPALPMVFALLLVMPGGAPRLFAQERPTRLNYVNAPLTDVIRSLSVELGLNVVLSDVPDARVTFSTPSPVARQDLGQVMESILESYGLVLVQSGPLARVVPADKALRPVRFAMARNCRSPRHSGSSPNSSRSTRSVPARP